MRALRKRNLANHVHWVKDGEEALEYLFLALVALTIVVSLQAVGIILVVAMLVTPAATAQLLTTPADDLFRFRQSIPT